MVIYEVHNYVHSLLNLLLKVGYPLLINIIVELLLQPIIRICADSLLASYRVTVACDASNCSADELLCSSSNYSWMLSHTNSGGRG